jgi:glycosyltransferase involved in cell wall biosynthesis
MDVVEVSVVIPCLNEAETVATCVERALQSFASAGLQGEVIVADNGSTDGSVELASRAGARVVAVAERGYGSALMGGIAAARGTFVVMADADLSYDLGDVPRFLEKLREGYDLVQGCRLPSGGGRVLPGAMPALHYWLGNPLFSLLARWWFRSPVRDIYCGLRGFRRSFQARLDQRCTGMEFAVEMVTRAALQGARIGEVPIDLHRDGRRVRAPHLKTWRDGWRTLRFLLLYTPRWLFLAPGLALMLLGLLGYAIALPGLRIGEVRFDAHTLLFASVALLCGMQALFFFLFTRSFATTEGLLPPDPRLDDFFRWATIEKGLALGAAAVLAGVVALIATFELWRRAGFGDLDYAVTMRSAIPGATLIAVGVQVVLGSFVVSLIGLRRR